MNRTSLSQHQNVWHFVGESITISLYLNDGWPHLFVSEWTSDDHLLGLCEVRLVGETCLSDIPAALAAMGCPSNALTPRTVQTKKGATGYARRRMSRMR